MNPDTGATRHENIACGSSLSGERVIVVAEIGVNHDGDVVRGLELVEMAHRAGADAVKLQVFRADRLVERGAEAAGYQREAIGATDQHAMLLRYELGDEDVEQLVQAIRSRGMMAVATPFSPEDVVRIERLNLAAIKIASPDLVNRLLLLRCASLGKPLWISTGAATATEIERTGRWLREWNVDAVMLHCVSSYPTPAHEARLGWMDEIARLGLCRVGYSDHTNDELAGALAVMGGARVVEKHLTWDRRAPGPDHAASFDEKQFASYVRLIRRAETLRGPATGPVEASGRHVLEIEKDVRRLSRQSLVLVRAKRVGEVIEIGDLSTRRPGDGIGAEYADRVMGKRMTRDAPAGARLIESMIEGWALDAMNPQEDA
jgi:N-acetylneuraminate synthase/N,N'-diacetyllegionaminate synthase